MRCLNSSKINVNSLIIHKSSLRPTISHLATLPVKSIFSLQENVSRISKQVGSMLRHKLILLTPSPLPHASKERGGCLDMPKMRKIVVSVNSSPKSKKKVMPTYLLTPRHPPSERTPPFLDPASVAHLNDARPPN